MNIYRLINESQLSSHISEEKYTKIAIEIEEVLFSTDSDEAKKDFLSRIINKCKDLAETHGVTLDESAKEDNYTDAVVDYLNDKEIKAVYANQVEGILKELFPDVEFTSEQVNSVLDQLEKGFGFLITENELKESGKFPKLDDEAYHGLDFIERIRYRLSLDALIEEFGQPEKTADGKCEHVFKFSVDGHPAMLDDYMGLDWSFYGDDYIKNEVDAHDFFQFFRR